MAGERSECLRGIGRAKCREADIDHRAAQRLRRDLEAVEVGGLALVGRHAVGRIALDMLNRFEALTDRKADVFCGNVVLEINEGFDPALVARCRQHIDHQPLAKVPLPRTGTDAADVLVGLVGHIGSQIIAPGQAALALRPQMHAGGPAAGHQQRIARNPAPKIFIILANLN